MTDLPVRSPAPLAMSDASGVLIASLTDYGPGPYAALLQASARFPSAPHATWLDLDHGIALGDVRGGALTLRRTVPSLPPCVVVAVVDPGVGTTRRAVALTTATGHRLVGPDNGLLEPTARRLGGVVALVDLGSSPIRAVHTAKTFDGRDLFGPVAGALAGGAALHDVGAEADPASLMVLVLPTPRRVDGGLEVTVLEVDHFGTLVLALDDQVEALGPLPPLGASAHVRSALGAQAEVRIGQTFADVPPHELVLYRDSDDALALARRGGSAAALLHAAAGDTLTISLDPGEDDDGPEAA